MTEQERERRDSRALEPVLISDPQERAAAEARNGFRQYDAAINVVQAALERGSFKLRPSLILGLHREALEESVLTPAIIVQAALLSKVANMRRSARTWSLSW